MNSLLIGATGYVGSKLRTFHDFDLEVNSQNVEEIQDKHFDLLVCAGIPAAKWIANANPDADLENIKRLAGNLSKVSADKAILISTIDVYQPPNEVAEDIDPGLFGAQAYGRNRAWFETFFTNRFLSSSVIRLPGLFSPELRKNLIYDLMNSRFDQLANYSPISTFQFFNLEYLWDVIEITQEVNLNVVNVVSEPVLAQDIATVFGHKLSNHNNQIQYDVRTNYAHVFGANGQYQYQKSQILSDLRLLAGVN